MIGSDEDCYNRFIEIVYFMLVKVTIDIALLYLVYFAHAFIFLAMETVCFTLKIYCYCTNFSIKNLFALVFNLNFFYC